MALMPERYNTRPQIDPDPQPYPLANVLKDAELPRIPRWAKVFAAGLALIYAAGFIAQWLPEFVERLLQ